MNMQVSPSLSMMKIHHYFTLPERESATLVSINIPQRAQILLTISAISRAKNHKRVSVSYQRDVLMSWNVKLEEVLDWQLRQLIISNSRSQESQGPSKQIFTHLASPASQPWNLKSGGVVSTRNPLDKKWNQKRITYITIIFHKSKEEAHLWLN